MPYETKRMEIAVDFDGTCTSHKYDSEDPSVMGADVPGAEQVLRQLADKGHRLILYTMRSKDHLEAAVAWFTYRRIRLYGIQKNPTQEQWTSSPKCYAQVYIDDAALGCPIIRLRDARPIVDWTQVAILLNNQYQLDLEIPCVV